MGDAQSAQREDKKDAAAGEESGKVDDVQAELDAEVEPLKNQISEINGKADTSVEAFNGHCEDEIAAEAFLSPDEDVANTQMPRKEEETVLENVEISEKINEPDEAADATEEVPEEMIEMEAKQNDINESFRRFFSNIGLKLTVKRGSAEKAEIATHVPEEEPNKAEDTEDAAKEIKSENAEQTTDTAQEANDNDSTTCPTLTDGTSEDFLENAEEKKTETKEEVESDNADAGTASPVGEDADQEEPHPTSEASPGEEVEASPFKRFFTTGIFSGLRKKKKPVDDEITEKELVDMGKTETVETTEQTIQDEQQDKEITLGEEAVTAEKELGENELTEEIPPAAAAQMKIDEAKSPSTDPSTIIVSEPEILSSQEKDKVQASPLKRLLSGSSLKRLSKKQRSRRSSDGKLSDSGEYISDQLLSSTESAENQKEESPAPPSAEASGEEDSAWASFKKLLTPKKRMKRSSLGHEEAQIPGSADEAKPSEGEQISDQSTEEGKKRKDSSVSWESVLCGSGRRRSRKTSDSEDESPQNDSGNNKHGSAPKQSAESPLESSNEVHEILASSPKQAGSSPESDGGSTWKSFKKLVTPKRKAKNEDENKDHVQSDSEVTHDDSSFSIKNLLPGRKKRKSAEKPDQVSSDEADKDVDSGDEDSETPAVVPLSEFDTAETGVQIETEADIEIYVSMEANEKLQQDLIDEMPEPVLPCDTEAKKVQNNEAASENEASTTPATNEEPEDHSDLISKHQQLSDIPEEGIITETMATPASAAEEAARDDTIADDLIEITSEAITAPEPVDLTQADETEMISAVSQLSESSKTSGNTTPVPAEYEVKDTELLLQQVAETISTSPKEVPVCSEELRSETTVCSVLHQILEVFEEQPKILETHRLDATSINTGLNLEAVDATAPSESVSDVGQAVSTEILTEASTEEFDTAEMTVDDIYEVSVEQSFEEFETTDESQHLVEGLSEVNEGVSPEILPEGEEAAVDQAENEISKSDSEETESAPTVVDEPEDGALKQKVQTLVEEEDQTVQDVTEPVQVEDQLPAVVDELEALGTVETTTLDSETGSVQSSEKEVPSSEGITPTEKDADGLKETAEHLTNVTAEPENKEQPVDSPKMDKSEDTETLEGVQAATLHSEAGSPQSLEKQVMSEDVQAEETVKDEPREETGPLTEVQDTSKTEFVEEPEVLEDAQAATLDSEAGSSQLPEQEVISEDVQAEETVKDEHKEETGPLTEVQDASKTEFVQEPEVLEDVQAATLDSEEGGVQSLQTEVISEDVQPIETVEDELREETAPLTEVNVEPVDALETEPGQEPEVLQDVQAATLDSEAGSSQLPEQEVISEDVQAEETVPLPEAQDASKTEFVQEPEVLQDVQAATLDSEAGNSQSLQKQVMSEDVQAVERVETVKDEPREETVPLTEVNVESLDASKSEHVQEPEVLQAVQTAMLDPEAGSPKSLEKEVISEDVPPADTVKDEPREETGPLTEVNVEPQDALKTEPIQSEVLQDIQTTTLDSEAGSSQLPENEVMSEDVQAEETVKDEPKEETGPLTEAQDASKTEFVEEPEVLEVVQSTTLDSEEGGVQSPEKEVTAEDVPPADTVKDEPREEMGPNVNVELVDALKPEHVQEPEVLEDVQAATLDSEAGSSQSLEEQVRSEDVLPADTVKDEPREETGPLTEVNVDPVDASKTEFVQETEVLEDAQATMCDSEEGGVQSHEQEVISEDVQAVETVKDEPKEETGPLTEVQDASKTEFVQEPEVLPTVQAATLDSEAGSPPLLEKEVTSEDITAMKTATDEPKQTTEVSVEPEELPPDVKDIVTETETAQSVEESSAHEKQTLLEDVPKAAPDNAIASVTDETVVAQQDQALEINKDTESIPQDAQAEHEGSIAETVDELPTLTAVHVPAVSEEVCSVQILEKTVFSEESTAPSVDSAKVSDEPTHEVHLSAVQVSIEGEKVAELPGAETNTAAAEHAVETQVTTGDRQEVTAAIPDVSMEKTSEIHEHFIDRIAKKFKETIEAAAALVKDGINETADEGSVVVMTHVPSVELEDKHSIQVQVVDVDVDSAENTVDTAVKVGVTETKEVINVCHETVNKVENVSATAETEEEVISEENEVTVQEVIQHVKESLPEAIPELEVVSVQQEVIKQPDAVTEVTERVASESNEVEEQKVMTAEGPVVIGDNSALQTEVSEDHMKASEIPGSLDVSIQDRKEDVDETETDMEKSEVYVTAEDVTCSSQEERLQTTQSQIVTSTDAGLVAPQTSAVISSTGNVESPSSLSLEFKVNTQFEQAKAPASPTPPAEGLEPVKQTDLSEVSVQAEEEEPVKTTQRVESEKQTELSELAVQATDITEPAVNFDSTERAVIANQPVLQDAGFQASETTEPAEHLNIAESETLNVQAAETEQPTEKTEVFLSQPVLSETSDQETKAEEPAKQTEEDNDQDVWLDAEEDIYTHKETEVSRLKGEEPSGQEEKAELEFEIAPNSKTEDGEQELHKAEEMCDIESEGEDFAVALEHPETATATITTVD